MPDDGTATCDVLLDILNTKAVIMVRSQKKMAAKSEDATNEEADLTICEKIVATTDKVTQAVKEGRESGVVVNPANETTSKGEILFGLVSAHHVYFFITRPSHPTPLYTVQIWQEVDPPIS